MPVEQLQQPGPTLVDWDLLHLAGGPGERTRRDRVDRVVPVAVPECVMVIIRLAVARVQLAKEMLGGMQISEERVTVRKL